MNVSGPVIPSTPPFEWTSRVDRSQPAKLHEQVATLISDLITEHALQPGDCLPKMNELAGMFSVSRTVVREALSTLAGRGLVEVKHGKGVYVADPSGTPILDPAILQLTSATEARNVLEARMAIEVTAAGLAAQRATEDDLKALQAALDRLTAAAPGSDGASAADVEFHQLVARATKNSIFATVVVALTNPIRHPSQALSTRPSEYQRSKESHERILTAIRSHNPQAAKRAMHEHLALVERSLEWTEVVRRMRDARPPLPSGI